MVTFFSKADSKYMIHMILLVLLKHFTKTLLKCRSILGDCDAGDVKTRLENIGIGGKRVDRAALLQMHTAWPPT